MEHSLNERYLYRRFDGFRDASKNLPYIDEREFIVLKDPAAQEAAFRSDQLSIWSLSDATYAGRLKQEMAARIEMDEYDSLGVMALLANITKPPWNDVRVREAIYRVTNREQYLNLLENGNGTIPPDPMQLGLSEYQLDPQQTEKYFKQDPRAARQLLEAAGFDCPHRLLRWQHTTTNDVHAYAGIKDPQIDAMIEPSEVTLDRDKRVKLVKEIEVAALEKYTPFICVYHPTVFQARWKHVRDYEANPAATLPMYRSELWLDL